MANQEESREFPRVEAAFRVRFATLDQLAFAFTKDLSKGGMFLKTKQCLPLNAVIRIHIELPEGGGDVPVISRVVYIRDPATADAEKKPAGMGIQFLDLNDERLSQIEKFISAKQQAAPPRAPDKSGPARAPGPLRVLVVDDNDEYREVAMTPFRKRGDEVRAAKDGLEAISLALKVPPDVILSDIQMPRMDGWQLLRIVRARPTLSAIPLIFLTTLSGEDERLFGYQLGVDDYVAKPYKPEDLVARVEKVVVRAQQASRARVDRKTLRGDIEQVSLPSVLSFLEMERKTGVLLVVGPSPARVFFRDGKPLSVEVEDAAADAKPSDMIFQVLSWTSGLFEFSAQDVACDDRLQTSATNLLLEHARVSDESSRGEVIEEG